jgi:cyanophycinase-like exopeptidase
MKDSHCSNAPTLLVIMGSGETTPSLANTHRQIFDRLGPGDRVMLDTPYGFQENADIITQKAIEYFSLATAQQLQVASLRRMQNCPPLELEKAVAQIRRANWIFAGPGSPSYVLNQWRDSPLINCFAEKLRCGGGLVFASAAACVLGTRCLPVYEIYKVGQDPHWLPGLNLLKELGLTAAILPHFNNTSGSNHDTRYCFMGKRHLETLEEMLEPDEFIIGVDEHTALLIDLQRKLVSVEGKGCVTIRQRGQQSQLWPGGWHAIELLHPQTINRSASDERVTVAETAEQTQQALSTVPLLEDTRRLEKEFRRCIENRQANGALSCLLELEQTLLEWSQDTDHLSQSAARSVFRSLLVDFGEAAQQGLQDPSKVLSPFVNPLMELRQRARVNRDWATADWLRTKLVEAGLEIHDTPEGAQWELRTSSREPASMH